MTIGKRIEARRLAIEGMTQQSLAELLGVSREMVRKWEADLAEPRRHRMEKLAEHLKTTVQHLELGVTDESNVQPVPPLHRYPLISEVQAGMWTNIVDNFAPGDAKDWIESPRKAGRHAFWLSVVGDSMEPRFSPGGMILVDPDASADPGTFVVAKLTDSQEATFKKLTFDSGQWYLTPLNRQYQAMLIDRATVRIIGRVVWFQPQGEAL